MKTKSAMTSPSSRKKTSSKDENNTSLDWSQTIKWVIIGLLILGIGKVLTQLFIASGPLFKGLEDVLGAGANVVEGLTNGCSTQPDCKKTKDSSTCKNQNNCGWNPPSQSGEEGTCINLSGRKSGSGGFFSPQCGLGIGLIAYFAAFAFIPLLKFLAARFTKNENVETAGRLNGKGTAETLKDVVNESRDAVEKISSESDEPFTDDMTELAAKQASNASSTNKVLDSITDPEQQKEIANEAIENAAKIDAQIIDDYVDKFSQDEIDDMHDKIDKEIEPFEFKAINMMIRYNIKPTKKAHAFLTKKILQKPISKRSSEHMNFLLKYPSRI